MRSALSKTPVLAAGLVLTSLVLGGGLAPAFAQGQPLDVRPAPQATVPGSATDTTGSVRTPAPSTGAAPLSPRGAPQGISEVPVEPSPAINPGRNALGCPDLDPLCQNSR
ncbi:hypothetical protein V5F77_02000 [Xanthobacter sp. DSM 24535]|uniref:hypothetical protein n=1 Tax=Roseixanthobacter psychrophilus TaxID=3119917 RepID=UPI0037274047